MKLPSLCYASLLDLLKSSAYIVVPLASLAF